MSTIPTYQKINAFMESAKPSVYTKSNTEGLDRVRKEDGMYAYFMEAASIEYNIERYCDLKQLGGLLDSKGYGIALPKGQLHRQIDTEPNLSMVNELLLENYVPRHLMLTPLTAIPPQTPRTRRPSRRACCRCRSAAC